MTETPGISCGYWNARNMPALARTSGGQAVMSSPWNRIRPAVTTYSGEPSKVLARVLLPDPLGPMMACDSPALTVSDSPRRMSSPVAGSLAADSMTAGLACRSSMRNSSLAAVVMAISVFPLWR